MSKLPLTRAVVTDAAERVALHVIRALGRSGIDVVATEVADRCNHCPGLRSRYAAEAHTLGDWQEPAGAWITQLMEIGQVGDVLMPSCFNSLLRVAQNRDVLNAVFRMLIPREETLLRANDKWALHDFSCTRDVPTPNTWCPSDLSDLQRIAELIEFPTIVKFRHDIGLYFGPGDRYALVRSVDTLRETWEQFNDVQPQPLVQEYIPGESYGFEALYNRDHHCVASFQHRRLVECPPQGGPSAVCESVRIPELEEYGRRLLDELRWTGVAMVEFRRCSETGQFYLLEINPRFWASVALSEAAGVNFPELYYRCACGEAVDTPEYRENVRLRLMPTYFASGLMSMRVGLHGVGTALSNLRYLIDPRVHEGLLTLDDPQASWAYIRKNLFGSQRGDG